MYQLLSDPSKEIRSALGSLAEQALLRGTVQVLFRLSLWLFGLMGLVLGSEATAWGQASWEYSPYANQVWLVTDGSRRLEEVVRDAKRELPAWSESRMLYVWDLAVSEAPEKIAARVREGLERLTAGEILALQPKCLEGDKLFLVLLQDEGSDIDVQVCEVDCRTRNVGVAAARKVASLPIVVPTIGELLLKSFSPTTKIETVEDVAVKTRLRAGGMIVDPQSPALVEAGQVLVPVIRRDDRNGDPMKNGILPLAWTVLAVKTRLDSLLVCELTSGFRTAIPTKIGARTVRYAVVAKPQLESTHVVLRSRGRGQLLAGYEVFSRADADSEAQLLGVTDWRGSIEIPSTKGELMVLIVKNGNQLLARLPLVPGYQAEAIATTIEDDARLEAEGFVQSFQGRIMDLVARREILASRMRKRIEEKKFDDAAKLLEEFRTLENRADLKKTIDIQQQAITSKDKLTQARIDKLIGNANKLNLRFLDPELGNVLAKELKAATDKAKDGS